MLVGALFNEVLEWLLDIFRYGGLAYWVARDNLVGVESGKGRIYAVLKGGHRVPVSRSFIREVRRAVDTRIPNE